MTTSLRCPLSLGLALVFLAGCAIHERTARPEPPALSVPDVTWQPHAGEVFSFEYPATWEIHTPAGQDPLLHRLRLHSASGFDGQLILVQQVTTPGTLPTRMLEKMQKEEQSLKAEAFTTEVAGVTAQGYRFSFDRVDMPWTGWVVSCTRGQNELCVMGRWPTNATDIRTQWSILTRNLRVKADGYPAQPSPPTSSKETPPNP